MIKLQIIGHLGKDAEVRNVGDRKVIAFNVAHSERYTDGQGNRQVRTTWARCSYWTDSVAVAPYLKKGTLIYTEGIPSVEAYLSTANQQPTGSLDLRVTRVELLTSKDEDDSKPSTYSQNAAKGKGAKAPEPQAVMESEDDLPF
jgi:single-strand DNA-binding protein